VGCQARGHVGHHMLRPLRGTRPLGFASPQQFLTGASGLILLGAELQLDEQEVQELLRSPRAPLHPVGFTCPCNAIAASMPAWLWGCVCPDQQELSALPFCLPLGLQERFGGHLQARTLSLRVHFPAVASPRAEESWTRQETCGWRCCSLPGAARTLSGTAWACWATDVT